MHLGGVGKIYKVGVTVNIEHLKETADQLVVAVRTRLDVLSIL